MDNVTLIALTGGIGSGKSYAADILEKEGYYVLSCDKVARELSFDKDYLLTIKSHFPNAVKNDGETLVLDRKALSEEVFSDKNKLSLLNSLTHPIILEEIKKRAEKSGRKAVIVEIPLLYESGYGNLFDKTVVIMRDKKQRIDSVKTRDNLSEEEILKRINSQFDYDNFADENAVIIVNDGNFKENLIKTIKNIT